MPTNSALFDDWGFDTEDFSAVDPDGKKHVMIFMYDREAPPPWLSKEDLREWEAEDRRAR